jgi:uncharacterized repeat protein (TIGR01451 family)
MRRLVLLWLGLSMLLAGAAAHAGTPIALANSWSGTVNFTGTEATMRTGDNATAPCTVYDSGKVLSADLSGIPAGATILAARLYWAGSGSTIDDRVMFQGAEVVAGRTYTTGTDVTGLNYFSGVSDVTAQVQAKAADGKSGNGTYTFSGLAIDAGGTYCSQKGVVGGFSLLVVYSQSNEPFRVMNLYEGFQFLRNSSVSLTMNKFQMPGKFNKSNAQLGHVTWDGNDGSADKNEFVVFNGVELTDKVNKSGKQFNSASTVNGDGKSYGIDFDAYVIDNQNNEKPLDPGATSVTTSYQTGDDLVLLSAEIIAVPNVQNVDLKLTMARIGDLQVGVKASYTLTVTNLGPNAEDGPITVTDTMPNGMFQPAGSGNGWSCSTSGQTVTCSHTGALAAGASLPPVTLSATITAPGTYTNTAAVAGVDIDSVSTNNTASDTAATIAHGRGVYVLTDKKCLPNVDLGSPGQCNLYSAALFAGESGTIFVTAVNSARKPTPLSATTPQSVILNFSLSCDNPAAHAGRAATYAGATLPLCSPKGSAAGSSGWQAVTLLFPVNEPSAVLPSGSDNNTYFTYEDVGSVFLNLLDSAGNPASTNFVVKPAVLDFSRIWRPRGAVANPEAKDGAGPGFAMAGEDFSIAIQACTAAIDANGKPKCGKTLPNFGNEGQGVAIGLQSPDPNFVPGFFGAVANGVITGTGFTYNEVGVLNLTPVLLGFDYLGRGDVQASVKRSVGRFYPAYFTAEVLAPFPCLAKMNCPAAPSAAGENLMRGAVYSGQPFTVSVTAFNYLDSPLGNYSGTFARNIQLTPVANPGGASVLTGASGTLAPATILAKDISPQTKVNASFTLPLAYSNAAPQSAKASGPTPLFVRATSNEELASGAVDTISSQRVAGSTEQGVTVIAGRLQLANAFGSELLKLPVAMKSQYWTGAAWENNTNDNVAKVSTDANSASFSKCTKRLSKDTAGNCSSVLGLLAGRGPVALKDGAGTLWLSPPGNGNIGSGFLDLTGKGSPPWLPSTLARVTFGIYQSPLIYIRELY